MTERRGTVPAARVAWRGDAAEDGVRVVPRETPIALTYNRSTHAVMLASPADLEDFAIGFSLSEGIIARVSDIQGLEIVEVPDGIECRMDLAAERLDALTRRQRRLAGPSGCGLCGLDSLAQAIRPAPAVPEGRVFTPAMVQDAMGAMPAAQTLNHATHAVHAAAFWTPETRAARAARGCRPPQCAGQIVWRAGAAGCRGGRRIAAAVQPYLGRNGAESRDLGCPGCRCDLCPDIVGDRGGQCGRNHADLALPERMVSKYLHI